MIEVININNDKTVEKRIKDKIKVELKKMEFKYSYSGTNYLIETIYILYTLKMYYNFNLEKDIYPIIVKKYGTSSNNIKNNIENSIEKMFYDCDERILENYIDDYDFSKPKPKMIIRAVLKRIKDL